MSQSHSKPRPPWAKRPVELVGGPGDGLVVEFPVNCYELIVPQFRPGLPLIKYAYWLRADGKLHYEGTI